MAFRGEATTDDEYRGTGRDVLMPVGKFGSSPRVLFALRRRSSCILCLAFAPRSLNHTAESSLTHCVSNAPMCRDCRGLRSSAPLASHNRKNTRWWDGIFSLLFTPRELHIHTEKIIIFLFPLSPATLRALFRRQQRRAESGGANHFWPKFKFRYTYVGHVVLYARGNKQNKNQRRIGKGKKNWFSMFSSVIGASTHWHAACLSVSQLVRVAWGSSFLPWSMAFWGHWKLSRCETASKMHSIYAKGVFQPLVWSSSRIHSAWKIHFIA